MVGAGLAVAMGLIGFGGAASPGTATAATATVIVKVKGNRLIGSNGKRLILHGVDRSGVEYSCVQNDGFADGPMDQASVDAMTTWGINAVRVPLNEDCWLGINGVNPAYAGSNYRSFVKSYVAELQKDHMVAILDLHWNAPGTTSATGQEDMADADHSPAFWTSVAKTFESNHGMMFDLYNEPHDITWACWEDGCDSPGFQTAGMQSLVDAVRKTGATQPVMLGPLGYSGSPGGPDPYGSDPTQGWLKYLPSDPDHQEVLSWHVYDFSGCNTKSCWQTEFAPITAHYPIVAGEFGETQEQNCTTGFDQGVMAWDDYHQVSYLAWAWNQASDTCGDNGPSVITDYNGDPTTSGAAIKAHYEATIGKE